MKMYRDQGMWNLVDQQGLLLCRGTFEEVKESLKLYW